MHADGESEEASDKAKAVRCRLATSPGSQIISPVAGRPEVGGKEQVAALWNIIKPLQSIYFVVRDRCQILALDTIFQVFLPEKGLLWRLRMEEIQRPGRNSQVGLKLKISEREEKDVAGACSKRGAPPALDSAKQLLRTMTEFSEFGLVHLGG